MPSKIERVQETSKFESWKWKYLKCVKFGMKRHESKRSPGGGRGGGEKNK